MGYYDDSGNWHDDDPAPNIDPRPAPTPTTTPTTTPQTGTPAPGPVSIPGFDGWGKHDVGKGGDEDSWINEGDVLTQLRNDAASKGVKFDDSDYQGVLRNISYDTGGKTLQQAIDAQKAIYSTRGAPTASAGGTGGDAGYGGVPGLKPGWSQGPGGQYSFQPNPNDPRVATTKGPPLNGPDGGLSSYNPPGLQNYPNGQFNDPYTSLLEQIAHRQIDSLTGQNPQTQQLMDFLNKRFQELSTSQGYSPEELALLNTQALEPIEAFRKASQQRELERTSRAGYLPSSGITLDQQRQIDTSSDQARTAANRDLGINAINQRNLKQNEALQLAQMGVQIPQQQNAQALDVANILYQLPRQAMLDANTIVNGSSPQNAIGPYIQLQQQQQQQALIQQQQNAQFWDAIGRQLLSLFGGH